MQKPHQSRAPMNIEKKHSLHLLKSRMSATNLRPSISAWTCQLAIRSVPGQSKRCLIWSFSCNLPAQQSVINRNLKHSAKQLGKPLPFFFDSPLRISCELQQTCRQNMHTLQMHSFAQHTWTFEVSCLPRSHHLCSPVSSWKTKNQAICKAVSAKTKMLSTPSISKTKPRACRSPP